MGQRFFANFIDAGNCEINPHPVEIHATSMTHALQKAAGRLPDETVRVEIFEYLKDKP